jgi:hypothetical protein
MEITNKKDATIFLTIKLVNTSTHGPLVVVWTKYFAALLSINWLLCMSIINIMLSLVTT